MHFLFYLQNFYLWKKDKKSLKEIKDKDKELLIQVRYAHTHTHTSLERNIVFKVTVLPVRAPLSDPLSSLLPLSLSLQENFCGTSIIVPDLEAVMYLKEDGKKSWKQRLFQLRASGIYYVPKGKTKVRGSRGESGSFCGRNKDYKHTSKPNSCRYSCDVE